MRDVDLQRSEQAIGSGPQSRNARGAGEQSRQDWKESRTHAKGLRRHPEQLGCRQIYSVAHEKSLIGRARVLYHAQH